MKPIIVIVCLLLLLSCNTEQKSRRRIELLHKSGSTEKYEVGISCMQYISQHGDDLRYSKNLLKKLLDFGFFAESINAIEMLQVKFPDDPELFYLKGLGYRNLLQYNLALQSVNRALKMQPENKEYLNAVNSIANEKNIWNEIQTLNDSLQTSIDSFHILLNRAEKLFTIMQYDAVVYDLGAISKMGSANDSIYFANSVSSIYQDGGRKSVEMLAGMIKYFQTVEDRKNLPKR